MLKRFPGKIITDREKNIVLKKILKYRFLILKVIYLTIKYRLVLLIYPRKRIAQLIYKKNFSCMKKNTDINDSLQPKAKILRYVDR